MNAVQREHTTNEWIDLMKGHTAWHRLLKYSQNQRFTTQLCLLVLTQYRRVTNRLTDGRTDGHTAKKMIWKMKLEVNVSKCSLCHLLISSLNQTCLIRRVYQRDPDIFPPGHIPLPDNFPPFIRGVGLFPLPLPPAINLHYSIKRSVVNVYIDSGRSVRSRSTG